MKLLTCLVFTSAILTSCHNREGKENKILRDFDSINQGLNILPSSDSTYKGVGGYRSITQTLEGFNPDLPRNTQELYDSIEKKFGDADKYQIVRQMNYTISDFYGYLSDLKRKFYIACGDNVGESLPVVSEDKKSLTNDFFLHKGFADYLPVQLEEVKTSFLANTTNIVLADKIKKLTALPLTGKSGKKYFMNMYFYNTPPVAAVIILDKFNLDIQNIENQILHDYLKQ